MHPIHSPTHSLEATFAQATIVNGFALLAFADGLTAIFEASTMRQLLQYAQFIYNAPLTGSPVPDMLAVEPF